jgi:outer membrane protein OmpA-like peptidoglycan-associated protein
MLAHRTPPADIARHARVKRGDDVMKLRSVLLAATIAAAPFAATAQPVDGPYIAGGVGANYRQDQDAKESAVNGGLYNGLPAADGKLRTQVGFIGLASVGYGLGNGLRFEIEGNFRENQNQRLTGAAFPSNTGGTTQTYGGMVNALYDFDLGAPVFPYVGVGAGYGETFLQNFHQYSTNPRSAFLSSSNQDEGNFAYQGIAGLAIPVGVPGLSVTAEYRFYGVLGDEHFSTTQITPAGASGGRLTLKDQYNHAGLVGFRYQLFNPPPPAPVVVPPVVPQQQARSFLVFFDWDKATLTERARQIIREAATTSTQVQTTRIEVNGYTDTSGTPKYNQGLSVRRADAVAAELVKDGVPKAEISIHGYGETRLLVQTGPGVREPQNRRVEIILK